LLSHQIDPNPQTKNKRETALHIACRKGFKKIIISLLNNNANPNIQDAVGKTSLHTIAELNSKELIVAFINHCKFPIEWDLTDNLGRKVFDVSTTKEITRLLNTYMKTATAQRYSRETRMYNKIRARVNIDSSNSRSNSREGGSISKRNLVTKQKSPDKSPLNMHQKPNKAGASNIMVHQTRNESVKKMFKNFNRTKAKLVNIRKNIDISNPKPNIKQEKYEVDKPNSKENSYMSTKNKLKPSNRKNYQESKQSEDLNRLLFQKPKNFDYKHSKLNSEGQIIVNETRGKKGPKLKSDHSDDKFANTQIVDYFGSKRRISVEEDQTESVPKIEISLNDAFNKKKRHPEAKQKFNDQSKHKTQRIGNNLESGKHNLSLSQNQVDSKSVSLNNCTDEISALIRNNFDSESIPNQLHSGKTLPHSYSKSGLKSQPKTNSLSKTKSSKKDITQTYDNSDMIRQRKHNRGIFTNFLLLNSQITKRIRYFIRKY
jgi:hypothetical protein